MNEYEIYTKSLIDECVIPKSEIFDYQFSPLASIYDSYFHFCKKYLETIPKEFNLKNVKIYFRNNINLNACAYTFKGYSLIGINSGSINFLHKFHYSHDEIFKKDIRLQEYKEIITKLKVPINDFMFQSILTFIYLHEVGHIIQRSNFLSNKLVEDYKIISNENFSIERHIVELDADYFATYQAVIQVISHFKELKLEDQNSNNITKTLSIKFAALISYFLLYYRENIYYFEFSHPHPINRISYLFHTFQNAIKVNLPDTFEILPNCLEEGFQIANIYFKTVLGIDVIDFYKIYLDESKNITEYLNRIFELSAGYPNLFKNRVTAE